MQFTHSREPVSYTNSPCALAMPPSLFPNSPSQTSILQPPMLALKA